MIPEWTNKYIGIPYKKNGGDFSGIDCYGLVRIILFEMTGQDIGDADADVQYQDMFEESKRSGKWVFMDCPRAGYVVAFLSGRLSAHVGIMIDQDRFIHATEGAGVVISSINSPLWKNRIEGYYLWAGK